MVKEAHLHIDLGEFRLTVGAEVFVAEALGDLVITLHATDHKELLKELRALWERVETAVMETGWDDIVSRAFWGRKVKDWGLDFGEVLVIEEFMDGANDLSAGFKPLLHDRAT